MGAACRGRTQTFYTANSGAPRRPGRQTRPDRERQAVALALCADCAVVRECRAYARTLPDVDFVGMLVIGGIGQPDLAQWVKAGRP